MENKGTKKTYHPNPADLQGYTQIPNYEIRRADLTPSEKAVFFYLISRSNKNGKCWPSMEAQCRDLGISENTLRKIHNKLNEKGRIHISKPNGNKIYEISTNIQKAIDNAKKKNSTEASNKQPANFEGIEIDIHQNHTVVTEIDDSVPSINPGLTSNDITDNLQELSIKEYTEKEKRNKEESQFHKNTFSTDNLTSNEKEISTSGMGNVSFGDVADYIAAFTEEEINSFDSLAEMTQRSGEPPSSGIKQKRILRKRALSLVKFSSAMKFLAISEPAKLQYL